MAAGVVRTAVAVHDVGPEQVAERGAEGMHEPSERPDDEQQHARDGMDLERGQRLSHQFRLRIEQEDRPEPG